MSKARTLANLISDNAELADGQISVAEVVGAAPLANPTFTGTASGTFSGPLTGDVTGDVTGNLTGNVTGDVAGDIDLSAISATIADTAVDIFVYDTRKDSDGGAWRKRTQHTSWYNETLNTATRGSRKEFPSVAVIAVTSTAITIYDGDDPDLPMWMVFTIDGSAGMSGTYMVQNTGFNHTVAMLNGILVEGYANEGSNYGSPIINFISEKVVRMDGQASGSEGGIWLGNIADRNSTKGYAVSSEDYEIVNGAVNDIAMTVLPNAPIDAATGLPVPTIAVATDGGVSVIKDDGTVVDITGQAGGSETIDQWVHIDPDGNLLLGDRGNGTTGFYPLGFTASTLPSSDIDIDNFTLGYATTSSSALSNLAKVKGPSIGMAGFAVGGTTALTHLAHNYSNNLNNMVAYTTSTYNTGWMNGDIKLATLSDTDATNVTGSELVTNGTFDSDTSGWTTSSATSSVTSGAATFTDTTGGGYVYQEISTTIGQTYTLVYDTTGSREAYFSIRSGGINGTELATTSGFNGTRTGTFSVTFVAQQTNTFIHINDGSGTAFSITVDNISVRLAEEDRSVNGNGLQVFGTVTKSAVSSGADLVAYSGFSSSNYLEQPYNSDLDFGTGDFCVMGWVKTSGGNGNRWLVARNATGGNGAFDVRLTTTNTIIFRVSANDFSNDPQIASSAIPLNTWVHFVCKRVGTELSISINGVTSNSSNVGSVNISNTIASLYIAKRSIGDPLSNGSLSLLRISATAPSPEQIARIYNDEKHLFTENAQATLYGSSDAVTALAYDDTTELLHVGTSAGRSVFQGLRRVDNTTDAVGAAISASNGLVAED